MNKRKLSVSASASSSRPPPKKRERTDFTSAGNNGVEEPIIKEERILNEQETTTCLYQNRQLVGALRDKNAELNRLASRIRQFEANQASYENTLSCVARHWESLNDNLLFLLTKVDCDMPMEALVMNDHDVLPPSEEPRTFLQMLLNDKRMEQRKLKHGEEEEEDEVEAQVNELSRKQPIDAALDERAKASQDLVIRVCEGIRRARARNEELSKSLLDSTGASVLAEENRNAQKKIAQLERMVDGLQHQNSVLKKQRTHYRDGWIQAERRTAQRTMDVEDARAEVAQTNQKNRRLTEKVDELQRAGPKPAQTTTTIADRAASPIKEEAPVKEEGEAEELRQRDNDRLVEIKALHQEKAELTRELAQLKAHLVNLPEQIVVSSQAFQVLQHQSRGAIQDLEAHRNQLAQLMHTIPSIEAQLKVEKEEALSAEMAQRKQLEDELKEKKAALSRIRNERSSLQYRLDQQKASFGSAKIISEYKLMYNTSQAQVKRAEAEVKRLKERIEKLQEEIRNGTTSTTHSTTSTTNGRAPGAPPPPPLPRAEDLQRQLESQKEEAAMFEMEMAAIAKTFEDTQEQNTRLLVQLSEKDDANTKLISERIKSEQLQQLQKKEIRALQEQIKALTGRSDAQREVLQKEEERVKFLEQQFERANEQLRKTGELVEQHKKLSRDSAEKEMKMQCQYDQAKAMEAEWNRSVSELSAAAERESEKCARLAEECSSLQRKYDKISARGSTDYLLEEELNHCKTLLRCQVCNDRRKDTVITRCFHVFCNQCIKTNLATRHRKCPACGRGFGDKDVHAIYLDNADVDNGKD